MQWVFPNFYSKNPSKDRCSKLIIPPTSLSVGNFLFLMMCILPSYKVPKFCSLIFCPCSETFCCVMSLTQRLPLSSISLPDPVSYLLNSIQFQISSIEYIDWSCRKKLSFLSRKIHFCCILDRYNSGNGIIFKKVKIKIVIKIKPNQNHFLLWKDYHQLFYFRQDQVTFPIFSFLMCPH